MLVLIRNITALNVMPYLSQYRFALDLALSRCVAHTIKSWDFPYTSKTHFPLLGTQYINDGWLCALTSRAPVLRIPHEPDGVIEGSPGPKVVRRLRPRLPYRLVQVPGCQGRRCAQQNTAQGNQRSSTAGFHAHRPAERTEQGSILPTHQ